MERSCRDPTWHSIAVFPAGTEENHENLSQCDRCRGSHLKAWPFKRKQQFGWLYSDVGRLYIGFLQFVLRRSTYCLRLCLQVLSLHKVLAIYFARHITLKSGKRVALNGTHLWVFNKLLSMGKLEAMSYFKLTMTNGSPVYHLIKR
jgi:hypothetical protein